MGGQWDGRYDQICGARRFGRCGCSGCAAQVGDEVSEHLGVSRIAENHLEPGRDGQAGNGRTDHSAADESERVDWVSPFLGVGAATQAVGSPDSLEPQQSADYPLRCALRRDHPIRSGGNGFVVPPHLDARTKSCRVGDRTDLRQVGAGIASDEVSGGKHPAKGTARQYC